MKYSIDRIENDIAILENIDNNVILEININDLPKGIKEGNILVKENDTFVIDYKEESQRKNDLINRFQRLKKK